MIKAGDQVKRHVAPLLSGESGGLLLEITCRTEESWSRAFRRSDVQTDAGRMMSRSKA